MLSENVNIYEYEEILLGQRSIFESSLKGNSAEKSVEAGNIWRYAVDKLLGWSAQDAVVCMTDEIATMLCLDRTFEKMDIRPSNAYATDYKPILACAYPDQVFPSEKEQIVEEYQHVARIGRYSHEISPYKYPKKFFIGENGIKRASILLDYAIKRYLKDSMDTEALYDFFSSGQDVRKWLSDVKLAVPLKITYQTPLDYFHYSIPNDEKDEFLYNAQNLALIIYHKKK